MGGRQGIRLKEFGKAAVEEVDLSFTDIAGFKHPLSLSAPLKYPRLARGSVQKAIGFRIVDELFFFRIPP